MMLFSHHYRETIAKLSSLYLQAGMPLFWLREELIHPGFLSFATPLDVQDVYLLDED